MSFQSQKSIMPGKQDWSQASIGIGTERRAGRGSGLWDPLSAAGLAFA